MSIKLKRVACLVLTTLIVFLSLPLQSVFAATNLITNPSVELNTNSLPNNWLNDSWGDNSPTFSYQNSGQNGTHSLSVTMQNYVSGDAKWYFEPTSVKAGHTYVYSDYYKATVPTFLFAQTDDGTENFNYFQIGTALATSSVWKKVTSTFVVPTNVSKITIFHFINSNGTVQTDNFNLHEADQITITNNVPNYSTEQVSEINSQKPAAWNSSAWGQNTTNFTYQKTQGYRGTHSLKTQITSYTSGDAKWFYQSQPISGNTNFTFSDYYKSDVVTRVVVQVTNSDQTFSYIELKYASPATIWTKYSANFTTPVNAVGVTVFHLLATVGTLTTDAYSVTPYTSTSFNRALVTLTFDDGWASQATMAEPMMQNYQFPATFYLVSGFVDNSVLGYLTTSQVNYLKQNGNEIGIHTINHPHLTTLNDIDLVSQLKDSQTYFQNNFQVQGNNFASPYGEVDSRVMVSIEKYYRSHRGVIDGYNTKDNFDIYNLKVKNVLLTTTPAEIQSWLNQTAIDHSWLILVYHQIDHGNDFYSTTPENFSSHLYSISNSKLPIVTIDQGLNEVIPQLNN